MLKERTEYDILDDFSGKKIARGTGWVLTAMGLGNLTYHFEGLVNLHAALTYHGKDIFGLSTDMFIPSLSTFLRTLPEGSPHRIGDLDA